VHAADVEEQGSGLPAFFHVLHAFANAHAQRLPGGCYWRDVIRMMLTVSSAAACSCVIIQ
jgi:hypothetical protein